MGIEINGLQGGNHFAAFSAKVAMWVWFIFGVRFLLITHAHTDKKQYERSWVAMLIQNTGSELWNALLTQDGGGKHPPRREEIGPSKFYHQNSLLFKPSCVWM